MLFNRQCIRAYLISIALSLVTFHSFAQGQRVILPGYDIDMELIQAIDSLSTYSTTDISLKNNGKVLYITRKFDHLILNEFPNELVTNNVFISLRSLTRQYRINAYSTYKGKMILLSGVSRNTPFLSSNKDSLELVSFKDYSDIDSLYAIGYMFFTDSCCHLEISEDGYKVGYISPSHHYVKIPWSRSDIIGNSQIPYYSFSPFGRDFLSQAEELSRKTTYPLEFGNHKWGYHIEVYSDEKNPVIRIFRYYNKESYLLSPNWSTPFVYSEYKDCPFFITGDFSLLCDNIKEEKSKTVRFSEHNPWLKFYDCVSYTFVLKNGKWLIDFCTNEC